MQKKNKQKKIIYSAQFICYRPSLMSDGILLLLCGHISVPIVVGPLASRVGVGAAVHGAQALGLDHCCSVQVLRVLGRERFVVLLG